MQNLRQIETIIFKNYSVLHEANKPNNKLEVMIKLISDLLPWIDSHYYIKDFTLKLTFYIYSIVSQTFN